MQVVEQETLTEALIGTNTDAAIHKHTQAQDQVQVCAQRELELRTRADAHVHAVHLLDTHLNEQVTGIVEKVTEERRRSAWSRRRWWCNWFGYELNHVCSIKHSHPPVPV